jgi:hypothetical protein
VADDESGVTKCACVRAVMPSSKLSRTQMRPLRDHVPKNATADRVSTQPDVRAEGRIVIFDQWDGRGAVRGAHSRPPRVGKGRIRRIFGGMVLVESHFHRHG